jgi:DNA-directed RNA polymerase subunit delta
MNKSRKDVLFLGLEQYSKEELKELSMIELAYEMMHSKKQTVVFKEVTEEIASILGLSREELISKLSQFYTDLNIDGRFICLGDNRWGLRSWYPYEQIDEEVLPQTKTKKKRTKKYEEDLLEDDLEEVDELDGVEDEELEEDFADDFDADEDEDEDDDLLEEELELDDEFSEEEEEFDESDSDEE